MHNKYTSVGTIGLIFQEISDQNDMETYSDYQQSKNQDFGRAQFQASA